jgi:hypothetical protein
MKMPSGGADILVVIVKDTTAVSARGGFARRRRERAGIKYLTCTMTTMRS